MTALAEVDQPRVPAGVPGAGQFASKACPAVYALLDTLVLDDVAREVTDGRSSFVPVPAPRCPHGHFARWAARHCRHCTTAPLTLADGDSHPCGAATADGSACTRRTTRTACHQHA